MPLLYDDEAIARVLELAGAARVLFGSDYPLLMPGNLLQRIQALVPAEAVQAVSGENARQIYMDMHDDE
jgi:predicted TIM-barrel fold metal-dependent hydrolase